LVNKESSNLRREALFKKVYNSGYTIDQAKKLTAEQWYKAGFSTKKLKKSSLEGQKKLLNQIVNHKQEILDIYYKKENIQNVDIIDFTDKQFNKLFKTKGKAKAKKELTFEERFYPEDIEIQRLPKGSYFIAHCIDENKKDFYIKYTTYSEFLEQVEKIENAGSGRNLIVESIGIGAYTEFHDKLEKDLLSFM